MKDFLSFIDKVGKIVDLEKYLLPTIVVIWCITTFLLFSPDTCITQLKLKEFMNEHGQYVGFSFVTASTMLVIYAFLSVSKCIQRAQTKAAVEKTIKSSMKSLDAYEKAVLREFFIQARNTIRLPADNSAVESLVDKGIIHQVGSSGKISLTGFLFSFSLSTVASKLIITSPRVIGLSPAAPSEEQKQQIWKSRPDFMMDIESLDW